MDTFKGDSEITVKDGLLVVYLVWVWTPSHRGFQTEDGFKGFYELRSISLTKGHAQYAKNSALYEREGRKVLVEERCAEHMYADSMFLGRATGDEPPDGYEGIDLA